MLIAAMPQAQAKTDPALHWNTPGMIRYGAGLNGNILDAWVSGHLPGTFVYSPAAGAVLSAGTHTLSVTFTPADSTDYNPVSTTVQLTVEKAVLTVGAFNVDPLHFPDYGTYGEAIPPLRYSIKNFVNGDDISAVSGAPMVTTTAVQSSPVGTYPISVAIGTLAAANYTFNLVGATLTITPAKLWVTPQNITESYHDPIPSPFKYSITGFRNGDTQSVVSGAPSITTTAVQGSSPGTYPILATIGTLSVPNYIFGFNARTLTIVKATSPITWPTPAAITYGTTLSATQLDAKAYVPGTLAYTPAVGAVLGAGTQTLSVTFTPANPTDYNTATATVQLTVNKATPAIHWTTPAPIAAGTALSSTQLDATSPVAGTFVYTPAAGTVPALGTDTLSVTFTPTDTADYTTATDTVNLIVSATGATTTTLAVTSAGSPATTVDSGTAVTLTATVKAGSTPITTGTVNFCDATAAHCEDIHIVGTAQLTSAGTASIKFRPGVGSHSYKAVFVGTGLDLASSSASKPLAVTGLPPSVTAISWTPLNSSEVTLTSTVGGNGSVAPMGSIGFVDVSGGGSLATESLVANPPGLGFLNSSNPATGINPDWIVVGDFNGDGIPDIAVTNQSSNSITVLLGDGTGDFTPAAASPATSTGPLALVVGDFNGDGKLDLAAVTSSDVANIFLGNGDGTFTASQTINLALGLPSNGQGAVDVVVADFNGDGKLDLAVACVHSNPGWVTILLGNGDGTFNAGWRAPASTMQASSVAAADFNGDGITDLAVVDIAYDKVIILPGNGDGTFDEMALSSSLTAGSGPVYVVAADFNGDGKTDLGVVNQDSFTVTVLLGNGDGTFTSASSTATQGGPGFAAVGDLNGDGIPDLVVVNDLDGTVTVLIGTGDGAFTANSTGLPAGYEGSVAVGDFNGAGISSLALSNEGNTAVDGTVNVLLTAMQTATAISKYTLLPALTTQQVIAEYGGDGNYKGSQSQPIGVTLGSGEAPASALPPSKQLEAHPQR